MTTLAQLQLDQTDINYCVPTLRERESNRYLLEQSAIREHIISGYGTRELLLPYTPSAVTETAGIRIAEEQRYGS